MNVLVTGATGFVGGWLTKALLESSNANVKILVRGRLPDYPVTAGQLFSARLLGRSEDRHGASPDGSALAWPAYSSTASTILV